MICQKLKICLLAGAMAIISSGAMAQTTGTASKAGADPQAANSVAELQPETFTLTDTGGANVTVRVNRTNPKAPRLSSREAYQLEVMPAGTTPEQVAARWKEWRDMRSKAMKWEIGYLALSAVDAIQTIECLERGRCREANPLYGKKPSPAKVILLKSGLGLFHFFGFQELNRRNPKTALKVAQFSAGVQGAVVAFNLRAAF